MFPEPDHARAGDIAIARDNQGSEIAAFVGLLRRHKWIIAFCTWLGVAIALALALTSPNVYQAEVTLRVDAPAGATANADDALTANIGLARTYKELLVDRSFLTQAAQSLRVDDLISRVEATAVPETQLIRLRATGSSPQEARDLTQGLAEYTTRIVARQYQAQADRQVQDLQTRLTAVQTEIQGLRGELRTARAQGATARIDALETQTTGLEERRAELAERISELESTGVQQAGALSVANEATTLPDPISPRPVLNVAFGLLFGLILGTLAAWIRDQLDRRVRDADEVERLCGEPVLATIPVLRAPASMSEGALANAFDVLRVNLALMAKGESKVYMITSAREGEGKTFTSVGLGRALARAGRRVVMVDGDLRRRGLSRGLETDRRHGLTEVLRGEGNVAAAITEAGDGLHLLPAGTSHPRPPTLLDSRAFEEVLDYLRRRYDAVIVDTPPILNMADSVLIGSRSDAVLVSVRLGNATRPDLQAVADTLNSGPFTLLGEVVHPTDVDLSEYTHYPRGGSSSKRRFSRLRRPAAAGAR